jgi:hypothetical protein
MCCLTRVSRCRHRRRCRRAAVQEPPPPPAGTLLPPPTVLPMSDADVGPGGERWAWCACACVRCCVGGGAIHSSAARARRRTSQVRVHHPRWARNTAARRDRAGRRLRGPRRRRDPAQLHRQGRHQLGLRPGPRPSHEACGLDPGHRIVRRRCCPGLCAVCRTIGRKSSLVLSPPPLPTSELGVVTSHLAALCGVLRTNSCRSCIGCWSVGPH